MLLKLGYDPRLKALPDGVQSAVRAELAQPGRGGARQWHQDYPAPLGSARRPARLRLLRAGLRLQPQHQRLLRPPDGAAADTARAHPRPHPAAGRRAAVAAGRPSRHRPRRVAAALQPRSTSTWSRARVGNYRWSPQLRLLPSRVWVTLGGGVSDDGARRGEARRADRPATGHRALDERRAPSCRSSRCSATCRLPACARCARRSSAARHRATLTDVITMACARALREHPGVELELRRGLRDRARARQHRTRARARRRAHGARHRGRRRALARGPRGRAPAPGRGGPHAPSCARRRSSPARSASRTSGRSASTASSALVLPPQAAILAVGSLRETVSLSASFDHRAVDGAPGGALPGDDRAAAGRARLGARGDLSRQPLRRARSGGATRGRSSAGRGRSRLPLAALSPASQAAT